MRKWTKMLGTLGLSLGILAACGNGNTDGGTASVPADEQVNLDIFNIKVETRDQLEELVARYEELNPHVNISVTTVGGGADAPAALQARFAAGTMPSIFMLGGLSDVELWEDQLLDVADTDAARAAIDGTLDGATLNGVVRGLPYNIEGFGWLINKEIFEQAGINPDSISSFDEFEAAVRKIDSMKDDLGLDAVFAFSGGENWVVSQFSSHFASYAYNNEVGAVADAAVIDWGGAEAFLQKYTDLINEFSIQPIITVDYSMAVEDLFVNGRVAMTHQGNWVVPTLDAIDPTFSTERLGILPFFVADNGTTGTIAAGPSWFWGVNRNADEAVIEESINFLNWLYTSEEGKERMIRDFGFIPAYTGNDSDMITDPVSKRIYEMLAAGQVTPWSHNSYPAGWFQNGLHPQWQRYVAGQIEWDEFIQNSADAWVEARR
ncbi:MAG: ABC transporter substrate-binding protein [Turicibacter sp.]|nr:ABC transporter substrate-binding protein [Turicibacter sp.]